MLDELYNVMIDQSFLRRFEHEKLTRDGWAEVSGELQTLFNSFQKPYGKLTFLDFGFGFGRWARVAKGMGARVFATEISPEKKKAAESLGVEIVDEDSLGQMQFDVVQAEQVAEHLTRPAETLQMLAQSVAPGGILKVAVPRPGKIKYLLRRFGMPDRAPQEHCLRHDASLQGVSDEDYVGVFPLEHLNLFCDKTMELLAVRLNMCIESKVRSRVLPIGIGSRKDLIRSAGSLAKETARRAAGAFLKNRGYYVFRAGGM
jgi:SAM-dependent methyltransferase